MVEQPIPRVVTRLITDARRRPATEVDLTDEDTEIPGDAPIERK